MSAAALPKALFIDVEVDEKAARDLDVAHKLAEVCPVDIFAEAVDGSVQIVEENLDECVLCYLCVEAAPEGSVRVVKGPSSSQGARYSKTKPGIKGMGSAGAYVQEGGSRFTECQLDALVIGPLLRARSTTPSLASAT